MLYREIIAVCSEIHEKYINAKVSVLFGDEFPTFLYYHVTNIENRLPRGAEPLPRTKTSASPLRRAESSREKTLRGQRVYCLGVKLVVELSLGFERLLSVLARQNTARKAARGQPSVIASTKRSAVVHSGVAEDAGVVGCDAVSFGE
jgi:hypothetical protein